MTLHSEAVPSKADGRKRRVDSAGERCIVEIHVLLSPYYRARQSSLLENTRPPATLFPQGKAMAEPPSPER